MNTEKWDF